MTLPAIDLRSEISRRLDDDLPTESIDPSHVRELLAAMLARIEALEAEVAELKGG